MLGGTARQSGIGKVRLGRRVLEGSVMQGSRGPVAARPGRHSASRKAVEVSRGEAREVSRGEGGESRQSRQRIEARR